MKIIERKEQDTRERIRLASKEDFDVSYFCGSGKGGQAKNKVASGVQIIHRETGALGRASDSRSQAENKKAAFKRLLATPKMKFWLNKKLFEVRERQTMEESIEKDTTDDKLRFEVMKDGKWTEVQPAELTNENHS